MNQPTDHDHLVHHASHLFPGRTVSVSYGAVETIYIDVDDLRFTFEIGSDDDEYLFVAGDRSFVIPLVDFDEEGDSDFASSASHTTNVPE